MKSPKAVRAVPFWKPEHQELLNRFADLILDRRWNARNCEIKYSITKSYKLPLFKTLAVQQKPG